MIEQQLRDVVNWVVRGDTLVCTTWKDYQFAKVAFPFTEVAQWHPALPALLPGLFALHTKNGLGSVDVDVLVAQLQHCRRPIAVSSHMIHPLSVAVHTDAWLGCVFNIARGADTGTLELNALLYQVVHNSSKSTLVERTYNAAVSAEPAWLETHFPGWADRFNIGVAMGYEYEDLAYFACALPQALTPLPLPVLDFNAR